MSITSSSSLCQFVDKTAGEIQEPMDYTNNDAHNALVANDYLMVSFSFVASQQGSEDTIFQKLVDLLDFAPVITDGWPFFDNRPA